MRPSIRGGGGWSPAPRPRVTAAKRIPLTLTALALAALASPPAYPQTSSPAARQQTRTAARGSNAAASIRPAAAGRQFIDMASRGNVAEVAAGRLALQKSQNEDVRRIAQMLIDDHTRAQTQLISVARRNGITPPATPDPMHQEMASRLQAASGEEFDQMFVAGQVRDHMMAISLYEHAANLAQDPDVSGYARQQLPGLREHTDQIVRVARAMRLSVSAMDVPSLGGGSQGATRSGATDMNMGAAAGTSGTRTGTGAAGTGTPGTAASGTVGEGTGTGGTGAGQGAGAGQGTGAGAGTGAGTTGAGGAGAGFIPLDAVRATPSGYMNRTLVGTARVGEKLGDRAFYLIQTTGAAAAAVPTGTLGAGGTGTSGAGQGTSGAGGGTGTGTGAAERATGANQGVLAILDDSFTAANTPALRPGQIVEITAIARTTGQQGNLPMEGLSQQVRDRVNREPVVLLIRRVSVSAAGGAAPSDVARPGS